MDAAITNTSPITNTDAGVPPEPPEARHQAGAENPEATGGDQDAGDAEGEVVCGLSATYSPDDNKLRLYSMSRLDRETYERVKAAGFSWAPKQGFFVAPMWTPGRADLLLALCGEIGDEDTTLVERAEDRADRF